VLTLVLAAQLASAAPPPAWAWSTTAPRRFYAESVTVFSAPQYLYGDENLEARLVQSELRVITTCTTSTDGPRRWQHECTLDRVTMLGASPTDREDKQLEQLLTAMDHWLTHASVQIRQRHNGRIVGFDLQGVPKNNQRIAVTHEFLRSGLRQMFAGLDFETPRELQDGVWVQTATRLAEVADSFGSVPMAHREVSEEAGRTVYTSFGKGSVDGGRDMRITGDTLWDQEQGTIVARSWKVIARERQIAGEVLPLANAGWIKLLGPDEPPPPMGTTGLWSDHAIRDTATTLMDVLLAGPAPATPAKP